MSSCSSSKPSTAPPQMLIKFRDRKNELWEKQPYGLLYLTLATEEWRGKDSVPTNLIRSTADYPGWNQWSPRMVIVTSEANFASFLHTSSFVGEKRSFFKCSLQPSHTHPSKHSMKHSINQSIHATEAQMIGNKQCCDTVPWSLCDKLKSLNVRQEALLLCTSVLTLMTYFINQVFFLLSSETERAPSTTWSPRERRPCKAGHLGDTEDEMPFIFHCLKCWMVQETNFKKSQG